MNPADMNDSYMKLQLAFKKVLLNTKLRVLHQVYLRSKKTNYANCNWMIKQLNEFGICIPDVHYNDIDEVQKALTLLVNINPDFIKFVLDALHTKIPKKVYFKNPKYKQLKYLYTMFKQWVESTKNLLLIEWISKTHPLVYAKIIANNDWQQTIHSYINDIHTALEKFIKDAVVSMKWPLPSNCSLPDAYIIIQNHCGQSFLIQDFEIIKKINKLRNGHSLAHVNGVNSIDQEEGIYLLRQIALIVEKINHVLKTKQ